MGEGSCREVDDLIHLKVRKSKIAIMSGAPPRLSHSFFQQPSF